MYFQEDITFAVDFFNRKIALLFVVAITICDLDKYQIQSRFFVKSDFVTSSILLNLVHLFV